MKIGEPITETNEVSIEVCVIAPHSTFRSQAATSYHLSCATSWLAADGYTDTHHTGNRSQSLFPWSNLVCCRERCTYRIDTHGIRRAVTNLGLLWIQGIFLTEGAKSRFFPQHPQIHTRVRLVFYWVVLSHCRETENTWNNPAHMALTEAKILIFHIPSSYLLTS